MKYLAVSSALSVALLAAVTAYAQMGPPPGGPGGMGRPGGQPGPGGRQPGMMMMASPTMAVSTPPYRLFERMASEWKLSSDQLKKLQTALQPDAPKVRALMEASAKSSKALRDALMDKKTSAAQLRTLLAAARKADDALIAHNMQNWASIRNILTADQLAALTQTLNTPMQGRPMMPGMGGGMGGQRGRNAAPGQNR